MTNQEVIVFFADLEVGARFRPLLLGAEGQRVYTKIAPREERGRIINAESDLLNANIPDSSRVLPVD